MADFNLISFFTNGGLATIFIGIAALFLCVLGFERLMTLYVRYSKSTGSALERIRSLVLSQDYTQALQVCNSNSSAPDLAVVKAGLMAVENGREAMKSALSGAVLDVSQKTEKRLPYIGLVANVATLLGLLGTITGLIKTFASLANLDPAEKAKQLGAGISQAMLSTTAGLVVGITAMVIYTFCVSKSDSIVGQAQDSGLKLITWVEQSERA